MGRKIILLLILLLIFPTVFAQEHKYTFENAERLKHLIDWRDYSPATFTEAIDDNKPIFLLLSAPSWCYWCQVYESEDYLFHSDMIDILNKDYVPVFVDADKRQDLTRQYLEGGWPSTTVMTPGRERLFGYSGVRPVENMVVNLRRAVDYVNTQGFSNQNLYTYEKAPLIIPDSQQLNNLVNRYASIILQAHDPLHGGFGNGQKFPQGRTLDFSLELYRLTKDQRWLQVVQTTLQNQYTKIDELETNYNLFDPVEGGFHRYGTGQDWTPPHFEKMLYDNARLLKTYFHLQQISSNELVDEVVGKTDDYIQREWYDSAEGGFFGNTDVHGEDAYYGKNPRPTPKARVEKTKYTDWNSEAILTYLYLWETDKSPQYKVIAEKSLDFFSREMITDTGAYHYLKEDGEKNVRGSLLDNSYLLLAFIQGYETLGKQAYLETAKKIADYSLENLYDWHSGAFFERNSPDIDLYAPGDNIRLTKPSQENGIISFALLKLYRQTNDPVYLNAALKTLGSQLSQVGNLDRGYYHVKASQFVIQNNLLSEFQQFRIQLEEIEKQKQQSFWLNNIVTVQSQDPVEEFKLSEDGLEKLQGPTRLLIIIALLAGFISFVSPCTLPILPAYVAYTFRSSKQNVKGMTLAFFLGLSIVFTLLGMSATLIGSFLREQITIFSQIAGIILIIFGLYIISGKGFTGFKIKQKKPTSYLGSFLFGGVFGISWAPCVGPILVAILVLASTTSSVAIGGILLFAYAIGLAIPLFLISYYLDKTNRESKIWKLIEGKELKIFNFKIHSTSLISGLLFIILGYLIFSGILFSFNQYVAATSFQKYIFSLEEWLINLVR